MYKPTLTYSSKGVPILKRSRIDEIANGFLQEFSPDLLTEPGPVNIELFAQDYMKFGLDLKCLSSDGKTLGLFTFEDTNQVVIYNEKEMRAEYTFEKANTIVIDKQLLEKGQETRFRFTFAHEVGHGILHQRPPLDPYDEYLSLFHEDYASPSHSSVSTVYREENEKTGRPAHMFRCQFQGRGIDTKPEREWNSIDWMEWQADSFASAILMPDTMVRLVAKRAEKDLLNDYIYLSSEGTKREIIKAEEIIKSIRRTFNVSAEAAQIRAKQLGITDLGMLQAKYESECLMREADEEHQKIRNEWARQEDLHYQSLFEDYQTKKSLGSSKRKRADRIRKTGRGS